jgi:cytochrome P450
LAADGALGVLVDDGWDPFAVGPAERNARFARLRDVAPAYHHPAGPWMLTRYEDCSAALRDRDLSSDPGLVAGDGNALAGHPLYRPGSKLLPFLDAPDHTRLRGLVSRAFTPRATAAGRASIEDTVEQLLDHAAELGEIDVVEDFASPLPSAVMCSLLGVPPADRGRVARWSPTASRLLDGHLRREEAAAALAASAELAFYMRGLLDERRAAPGPDLLSGLAAAEGEGVGARLSSDEIVAMAVLLFVAGHETTANAVANGVWRLLAHPAQLRALRDDPALARTAAEEAVRYDAPLAAASRVTRRPTVLHGRRIPEGSQILVMIAAANRDPRQFPRPDEFDIRRADNPHLGFSAGPHLCLGASLARLEIAVALDALVRRFPTMELAGTVDPRPHVLVQGLAHLPVRLREPRF